ncbi:hypothetical protein BESB_078730 [Besnoitia besnoiti]|uniref:Uncharacterized protein n=1 Tax=Besnoitia besnoiti TaxID=94643 RepID=A0A2A9MDH0_BESBE|nr:hypothetical protein BESB_078730 [Besnoitia besnoiti]PFH33657.1 hypothetical protein BESB_078730 [Besnoitia besnoiti]
MDNYTASAHTPEAAEGLLFPVGAPHGGSPRAPSGGTRCGHASLSGTMKRPPSRRILTTVSYSGVFAIMVLSAIHPVFRAAAGEGEPGPHAAKANPTTAEMTKLELMSVLTDRLALRWKQEWTPFLDANEKAPMNLRLGFLKSLTAELNETLDSVLAAFPAVANNRSIQYWVNHTRSLFVFTFRSRLRIGESRRLTPVGPYAGTAYGEPDPLRGAERWPPVVETGAEASSTVTAQATPERLYFVKAGV